MKILVVDDNADDRALLEKALISHGYFVAGAANGALALEMALDCPPDLIVSDILMPEMDGFELCRRVKQDERLRQVAFIFYSATFVEKKDEQLALSLGASRFLVKPLEPREFLDAVESVIDEHRAHRLSVPDRPLGQAEQLDHMHVEALTRKLEKKVNQLEAERDALASSEENYRQLNETLEERIKKAVDELRDKDRWLMIKGRQAVMGELISDIAHHWRQPLNMLGLLAQELSMTYKMGSFSKELLDSNLTKTMDIIQQMSRTIEDFSIFSKPDRKKIDFRVIQVVAQILSLLEESFKAHGIGTDLNQEGDPVINGYPNEYSQALLNILINAREALLARKVESPGIVIRVFYENGRTVVTVTDNAGGIAPEIIDRIFEPYFTTKGPEQGTGIGLFLSKTIIEKTMNGVLSARNTGSGAQFRIEV
jgi:signal transduction histidine kinase